MKEKKYIIELTQAQIDELESIISNHIIEQKGFPSKETEELETIVLNIIHEII